MEEGIVKTDTESVRSGCTIHNGYVVATVMSLHYVTVLGALHHVLGSGAIVIHPPRKTTIQVVKSLHEVVEKP